MPLNGRDTKSSNGTQSCFSSCDCGLQGVTTTIRQSCAGKWGNASGHLGCSLSPVSVASAAPLWAASLGLHL